MYKSLQSLLQFDLSGLYLGVCDHNSSLILVKNRKWNSQIHGPLLLVIGSPRTLDHITEVSGDIRNLYRLRQSQFGAPAGIEHAFRPDIWPVLGELAELWPMWIDPMVFQLRRQLEFNLRIEAQKYSKVCARRIDILNVMNDLGTVLPRRGFEGG